MWDAPARNANNVTKSRLLSLSYLRKSAFICGSFLLLFTATSEAFAQGGGKAEPNRIEFKRGATSATVSGYVRNDEEAEYVLTARQGQRLIIKLTNVPAKSSCFDLKGPDGADVGLEYDCNWNYSKVLTENGDYFITVARPSQARGRSRYRLTVTVK